MRFGRLPPWRKWERIFAWVPHWCDDVEQYVWLEHVYRECISYYMGCSYNYRTHIIDEQA